MIVAVSFKFLKHSLKNAIMQNFSMSVTKFSYSVLFDNTRQFNAALCLCTLKELLYEVSD